MSSSIEQIQVDKLPIRLGQFLKLANLVQDGFEAKVRIQEGEVLVNETVEIRRGKKLNAGDRVEYNGEKKVVSENSQRKND